eukprot:scaffold285162_cov31-Tisochrysis_lutea.AAC.3
MGPKPRRCTASRFHRGRGGENFMVLALSTPRGTVTRTASAWIPVDKQPPNRSAGGTFSGRVEAIVPGAYFPCTSASRATWWHLPCRGSYVPSPPARVCTHTPCGPYSMDATSCWVQISE